VTGGNIGVFLFLMQLFCKKNLFRHNRPAAATGPLFYAQHSRQEATPYRASAEKRASLRKIQHS
ncbi:MAG TPA: hypothetical protein PLI34_06210, partial [Saprospiraceae bacterium]|nr:hypothetical protein [Saprospiraceae bacterium]